MQGYVMTQASFIRANSCACPCIQQCYVSYTYNRQLHFPSHTSHTRINHVSYVTRNIVKGRPSCVDGRKRFFFDHKRVQSKGFCLYATLDVASAIDVINDLGLDTLTFLAVTVLVVPGFRIIKASPVSYLLILLFKFDIQNDIIVFKLLKLQLSIQISCC